MRASPAVQISLQRFGAWRAAMLVLAAAGLATMAAWLLGRALPVSSALTMLVAAAMVLTFALAVSLWRVRPQRLHWNGQAWHVDEVPGELLVAIDLGPWMLLRFLPDGQRRVRWLPVQRRGLESQWHALRCAVHSPRSASEP